MTSAFDVPSGAPDPFVDVWSRTSPHHRRQAIGMLLLLASFAVSPTFMLQNLPMGCVLLFAPLVARQISGVARRGSVSWRRAAVFRTSCRISVARMRPTCVMGMVIAIGVDPSKNFDGLRFVTPGYRELGVPNR